jgi:folylpolyglutamate synthase/dihydropteroate synthase
LTPGAEELGDQAASQNQFTLAVRGKEIKVDFPLPGRHQLRNLALAITTAEELNQFGFHISAEDIEQGIRATSWPA